MSETHTGNLIIEPHQVGTFQVYHDSDDCTEPHAIFDTLRQKRKLTSTKPKEHQNNESNQFR